MRRAAPVVAVVLATLAGGPAMAAPSTPPSRSGSPTPGSSATPPPATRFTGVRVTPANARAGQPLVVTGRLLDELGAPLANREVDTLPLNAADYLEQEFTGADGRFRIRAQVPRGTTPGRTRLRLQAPADARRPAAATAVALTIASGGAPAIASGGASAIALPSPPVARPPAAGTTPDPTAGSQPAATPRAATPPAPHPPGKDALPLALKLGMGSLAALGVLLGVAVASRDVRPHDDEPMDHFIG